MSLQQLLRETFVADFCTLHHQLRIHRGTLYRRHLKAPTVSTFGWDLFEIKCLPITKKGRRFYVVAGVGFVTCKELRKIFSNAGFANSFMFTADALKVKRAHSAVHDHYFEPQSADFRVSVGVTEGNGQVDWKQFNTAASNYTLMAALKKDT
jgi:hypothetical protein